MLHCYHVADEDDHCQFGGDVDNDGGDGDCDLDDDDTIVLVKKKASCKSPSNVVQT